MKYWCSVWTMCNTFPVRVSIEKPQIQFYKCNNHKSLNAPSSLLLAPSEAWTIKFNIMAPTKIGCLSAVLLEGDYVREGSMGRLLSSSGSKILLGLLKIMCTIQVLLRKVFSLKSLSKLKPIELNNNNRKESKSLFSVQFFCELYKILLLGLYSFLFWLS